MGQKIHPVGFRLAVNKDWSSKWFAKSTDFATVLKQDIDVREYLSKRLANASVGRIVIERPAKSARITIHSARPGVVIGQKGADIEILKQDLENYWVLLFTLILKKFADQNWMLKLLPMELRSS